MKRPIFCAALILATIALAGCRNGQEAEPEPEIALSKIRITGIPNDVAILMAALDGSEPKSRGLAAAAGIVVSKDGESTYTVSAITDGTAVAPLHYGADAMLFLFALMGFPPPIGMAPPVAVPDVTTAVVSGRGDVVVNHSGGLDTLMSAETGTRVWRNIRFADSTANRILTLDWNAGE